MASRTLLEPGRETRRRPETARPVASAAPPPRRRSVLAGPDRGRLPGHRRAVRDRRGRRAAARPRPRRRAVPRARRLRRRAARRARHRDPRGPPRRARAARRARRCGSVRRERWTPARAVAGGHRAGQLLRQLHGVPQPEGDRPAAAAGRHLRPPAGRPRPQHVRSATTRPTCCTAVLGVGVSTHILSTAYAAFIVFLPLSLAVALVFSRDIRAGLFYATALSANWVLGAASYFLLPVAGADLLRAAGLRAPPPLRGHPAPGHAARPARRVPRPPDHARPRRASRRSPRCTSR